MNRPQPSKAPLLNPVSYAIVKPIDRSAGKDRWRQQSLQNWQEKLDLHNEECNLLLSLIDRQYPSYQKKQTPTRILQEKLQRFAEKVIPAFKTRADLLAPKLSKPINNSTPAEAETIQEWNDLSNQFDQFEKEYMMLRLKIVEGLIQKWPVKIY